MKLSFSLTEHDGIGRKSFPVTGGVPLPQGQLREPARLVLRDAAGARLPLQAEITARWPDGSARWVLLDFQTDLEPLATRSFTLETGEPQAPQAPLEPWGVVDGEPLPRITAETMLGSEVRLVDAQGRTWHNEPGATTIERQGALHATMRTRGLLKNPDGDRCVHWEAYTDFHRGVRWAKTRFVYWGSASDVSFIPRPATLPKPLEVAELAIVIRLARVEGRRGYCCSRSLWQGARKGVFEADHPLAHVQTDEQAWRITDTDGRVIEKGEDKSEGYAGSRIEGADGLGVALAEIWQSHPKALRVSADTLEIALWPRESVKPMRLWSGAGRAHHLYLTPYREPGGLRLFAISMMTPIQPRLELEAFNRTRVMPSLLSPANSPVPLLETLTEAMFPGFNPYSNADTMGAWGTGEWNWGDFRAPIYETRNMPIGHGEGATIWANGEAQMGYGLLLQFLRTGRSACLTMGLACASHKAGVDTIHDARQAWQIGAQHIHCLEHATAQCVTCHMWTNELALGWLLTGDRWLRSVLERTAEYLIVTNREAEPRGFQARAGGWLLIALCGCYEGLGDPRCLEVGRRVVEGLRHWIDEDHASIAIPPAGKAHSPAHLFIAMTGLADFERLTGDPAARAALLAGGKLVLERGRDSSGFFMTADAPGYRSYSQVPRWPLAQSLAPLDALYRLTGDPQWIETGLHQCRLLFKLLQAETGWREEKSWPHAGSLHYAYAFSFLESARQTGKLVDLA